MRMTPVQAYVNGLIGYEVYLKLRGFNEKDEWPKEEAKAEETAKKEEKEEE